MAVLLTSGIVALDVSHWFTDHFQRMRRRQRRRGEGLSIEQSLEEVDDVGLG